MPEKESAVNLMEGQAMVNKVDGSLENLEAETNWVCNIWRNWILGKSDKCTKCNVRGSFCPKANRNRNGKNRRVKYWRNKFTSLGSCESECWLPLAKWHAGFTWAELEIWVSYGIVTISLDQWGTESPGGMWHKYKGSGLPWLLWPSSSLTFFVCSLGDFDPLEFESTGSNNCR